MTPRNLHSSALALGNVIRDIRTIRGSQLFRGYAPAVIFPVISRYAESGQISKSSDQAIWP